MAIAQGAYDGFMDLRDGMNALRNPALLPETQYAKGLNMLAVRGGLARTRYGLTQLPVSLPEGDFQGCGVWSLPSGGRLVYAASGIVYTVDLESLAVTSHGALVRPGVQCYFGQADKYMIVQDGVHGLSEFIVAVSDSDGTSYASFKARVTSDTVEPLTMSVIPSLSLAPGGLFGPLEFTVSGGYPNNDAVTVTVTSDNASVGATALTVEGSGGSRQLYIQSTEAIDEAAVLRITATDGYRTVDRYVQVTVSGLPEDSVSSILGTPLLDWTFGGSTDVFGSVNDQWAPDTDRSHSGGSSLKSPHLVGNIGETRAVSHIRTKVVGPGTFSFFWDGLGRLAEYFTVQGLPAVADATLYYIVWQDGVKVQNDGVQVFGQLGWSKVSLDIPAGNPCLVEIGIVGVPDNSLVPSEYAYRSTLWVDSVTWTPAAVSENPPSVSYIADQSCDRGGSVVNIPVTLTAGDIALDSLTLRVYSTNLTLLPVANAVLSGSGSERYLTLTPVAGLCGISDVLVVLFDGSTAATSSFRLSVGLSEEYTAPVISDIRWAAIPQGGTTGAISFSVTGINASPDDIHIAASSSSATLFPASGLEVSMVEPVTVAVVTEVEETPVLLSEAPEPASEDYLIAQAFGDVDYLFERSQTSDLDDAWAVRESSDNLTANLVAVSNPAGREVVLSSEVEGPGVVTFSWRLFDATYAGASLLFYVDSTEEASRTGLGADTWADVAVNVSAGTHTLYWKLKLTGTNPLWSLMTGRLRNFAFSGTASSGITPPAPPATVIPAAPITSTSGTITVTPDVSEYGSGLVHINVFDGLVYSRRTFGVRVSKTGTDETPLIEPLNDLLVAPGDSFSVPVYISDAEDTVLSVAVRSGNTQLFAQEDISVSGTGGTRTLSATAGLGQSDPVVLVDDNGTPTVYTGEQSIPKGYLMTYAHGRIHMVPTKIPGTFEDGRASLLSGDILTPLDPSTVLKFESTEYLAEGGAHGLPAELGYIGGLGTLRSGSTGTGYGTTVVFAERGICAFDFSISRTQWKATQISTALFSDNGCRSPWSVVNLNSDLLYRGTDGIRSLAHTAQQVGSGSLANTPISLELNPYFREDYPYLKYVSASVADNRMLTTTQAAGYNSFKALASYDVAAPAYSGASKQGLFDGLWTGDTFYQTVSAFAGGARRHFIFAEGPIIYYVDPTALTDNGTPIEARLETRMLAFQDLVLRKQLKNFELWLTDVMMDTTISVWYRPFGYYKWFPMGTRTVYVPEGSLPQGRMKLRFTLDSFNDVCDPVSGLSPFTATGFQFAIQWTGNMVIERGRAEAMPIMDPPPEPCDAEGVLLSAADSESGVVLDDYSYSIRGG